MSINNSLQKKIKKIKHIDKTKSRYIGIVAVVAVIGIFSAVSFSAFVINDVLNTTIIKIAKLDYTLNLKNASYVVTDTNKKNDQEIKLINENEENSILLPADSVVALDLELSTTNTSTTKYSISYASSDKNITVNYSEDLYPNMSGLLAPNGNINMRLVLTNPLDHEVKVGFIANLSYENNKVDGTNINEGYFEHDFVSKVYKIKEDGTTSLVTNTLLNDKNKNYFEDIDDNYYYYQTVCTNNLKARMSYINSKWNLVVNNVQGGTVCNNYYKKVDNELVDYYYELEDTNKMLTSIKEYLKLDEVDEKGNIIKEDDDYYELDDITCSNGETNVNFDEEKKELVMITGNVQEEKTDPTEGREEEKNVQKTICVGHFKHSKINNQ